MNIITNNIPRQLLPLTDLPAEAQKEFDYIENYDLSYRFVQYKGCWYDVYDTQVLEQSRLPPGPLFKLAAGGWDSIVTETFFSGVVFRLVGDDEVIVGRYCV
jgi:hypothetical protein